MSPRPRRLPVLLAALLVAAKTTALLLDPASLSWRLLPNLWLVFLTALLVRAGLRSNGQRLGSEAFSPLCSSIAAGARTAWWAFVRLPGEVAPLFRDWLERVRPGHAVKVMNRVREMRGGRDNDPEFHSRFRGEGPYADMVATRIRVACNRLGFEASHEGFKLFL